MKVTIEIECDDWNELAAHIHVIRKQLKKRVAAYESSPTSNLEPQEFEDNNCYGTHEVKLDFE